MTFTGLGLILAAVILAVLDFAGYALGAGLVVNALLALGLVLLGVGVLRRGHHHHHHHHWRRVRA